MYIYPLYLSVSFRPGVSFLPRETEEIKFPCTLSPQMYNIPSCTTWTDFYPLSSLVYCFG